MLIPERKAELVAALRSGDYKQGKTYLKKGDEFCCLGVACDLYAKKGYGNWIGNNVGFFLARSGSLPDDVQKYYGFTQGLGDDVTIRGTVNPLAFHNDSEVPFAEIADAIEQQL
jgi:hypothetical protein